METSGPKGAEAARCNADIGGQKAGSVRGREPVQCARRRAEWVDGRNALEQLCRCITHLALANERVQRSVTGQGGAEVEDTVPQLHHATGGFAAGIDRAGNVLVAKRRVN